MEGIHLDLHFCTAFLVLFAVLSGSAHFFKIDNDGYSDFIWDFRKLPLPSHLGKYFNKIGKIRAKIHEIGKIKAIFGLGMRPIYGLKSGQIKSLGYIKSFH